LEYFYFCTEPFLKTHISVFLRRTAFDLRRYARTIANILIVVMALGALWKLLSIILGIV
jgi:hypothetical protein